jgi:hypothetical protein
MSRLQDKLLQATELKQLYEEYWTRLTGLILPEKTTVQLIHQYNIVTCELDLIINEVKAQINHTQKKSPEHYS